MNNNSIVDYFPLDLKKKNFFVKKIREWGKLNIRDFPWRKEKNLFRLLLSEIFLQKTDSLKVKEIYPFLEKIETPSEIEDKNDILDMIVIRTGLKYKKDRIFFISNQIMELFNGKIPGKYNDLIKLKGVGDYIANAVLSFGFQKRSPIIDTNTINIIQSFFGFYSQKKRPRDDRKFNKIMMQILPKRNHVKFNYYLLDFGALVCTKNKKNCYKCILRFKCNYHLN